MTNNIIAVPLFSDNGVYVGKNPYIEYPSVKGIINKLLTCDRIILVPTKILKFTELELANKLSITTTQLRQLRGGSQSIYEQTIEKISPLLSNLYCYTKWEIS